MLRIFTTLILALSVSLAFGQVNITANVNPSLNVGRSTDFDITGKVTITNTSAENKAYTWVRDESGFAEGWESAVCDINNCFERETSTATFELAAGMTGTLDLHMHANGFCGKGFAEVTVTDNADDTNFLVIKYEYEALEVTGVDCSPVSVRSFELDHVQLYPNPASDFFNLTDVPAGLETITVYNILGNKVKSFKAVQNANYNIRDLNKGLYLVNLSNSKGENLNTIKLHKN